MVTLAQIPATPSFIAGFLDWQDGTTPTAIVRLDILLRLPQAAAVPGLHTPIILLRAPIPFGLLVERIEGLISSASDNNQVESLPEQSNFNGCAIGLLPLDQGRGLASVLSVERLLLTEEQERLQMFTQLAHERRTALEESAIP